MVQVMKKWFSSAAEFISWDFHAITPAEPVGEEHKIGEQYFADYSDLSPEQLKAAKEACAEHIARSKVISVKSGL